MHSLVKDLFLTEKKQIPEVRKIGDILSREVAEELKRFISTNEKNVIIFILRGAMLMYNGLTEILNDSAFGVLAVEKVNFENVIIYNSLKTTEFDNVILADFVVETGNTIIGIKNILSRSIKAERWFLASVCVNKSAEPKLEKVFDKVFCIDFLDDVRNIIDAGDIFAGERNT